MADKTLRDYILKQLQAGKDVQSGDENEEGGTFFGMPYSKKTQKEMNQMVEDGAGMSGGLGSVGKVASKALPGIGKKLVDILEPQVDEAGIIANQWTEPFQGVRRYLQETLGTGAANDQSKALHKMAGEAIDRREAAALRANADKTPSVDQLIEGRRKVDLEADALMKERLKKEAEELRRKASAEELTIPGLKGR